MRSITPWLAVGIAVGVCLYAWAAPRAQVKCRAVPNGANSTIACSNGYWITTTPDGEVFTGNGMADPSASAAGSTMAIDPATGGPVTNINRGSPVAPPTQVLPQLAPYQAETYGYQPRYD